MALLHVSAAAAAFPACDLCLTASAGNLPLDSGMAGGGHFQKTLFSPEIDSEPDFFMLFTVN